jgi:hypothetical protein
VSPVAVHTSRASFVRHANAGLRKGTSQRCAHCDSKDWTIPGPMAGRQHALVVLCNVYIDGRWDHIAFYHRDCYRLAGEPYGPPAGTGRKR